MRVSKRWLTLLGGSAAAWYVLHHKSPYAGKIRRSVVIGRPRDELYRFWRNLENLPRFMTRITSVQMIDDRRSHWAVQMPSGRRVEWDGEIVADRENEMIGWRSAGGPVDHEGSVWFERAPGGRGTVVRVQVQSNRHVGRTGAILSRLLAEDLQRFKQLMEGSPDPLSVRRFREEPPPEPVEASSEDSFPASDAPSWTAGGGS